jgi:hypothetical protein
MVTMVRARKAGGQPHKLMQNLAVTAQVTRALYPTVLSIIKLHPSGQIKENLA